MTAAEQAQLQPHPSNGANGAAAESTRRGVNELSDGDPVSATFVVRDRELRKKKNGEDFLKLTLGDRSGSIEAVAWEEVEACHDAAARGSIVHVSGRYTVHPRYGAKITIEALRPAKEGEVDTAEIAEGPRVAVEQLESDLRQLIATVRNPYVRALLDRFFAEDSSRWPRFRDAPAAKYYHEAYRHGLLDHTLSVAHAVSAAASSFPGVDRDIAVTGALLHDIGKTQAYNDDPLAIELTDAGRLQGEIALGYYAVRREIERIEGFPPDLAQAVLHIVLSHHGTYENGSPVVPATREATLVHAIDNLGGKLGSFDRIERELRDGEAWSRFDRGIESAAYFGSTAA